MDITWHGNTCFKFKDSGVSVIINPDKDAGKLQGDIVLSSLGENTAEIADVGKVIDWPGEYEIKNIPVVGFQAWTKGKKAEEEEGHDGEQTVIYYFELAGFKMLHLGELGHTLTSDAIKEIGDVDILLITVGEKSNLNDKKMMEIIEAIDPRMVIPMGADNPGAFMKDIGSEAVEEEEKVTMKSRSELPDDKRRYVLLKKS